MALTSSRAVVALALAVVLAYANTLRSEFVWDDEVLVKDNPTIRNFTYAPAAFVSDLARTGQSSAAYYRPLQTISYMVDYRLWGLNPAGYHLTNLVLHFVCVVLLWLVVRQFGVTSAVALVVALLFAVHPVNTNAVAYVAGRADLLAGAGLLGALLCCGASRHADAARLPLFTGAILCFLIALFSRENAMLLPALVLVYGLVMDRRPGPALRATLPFLIVLGCFLLWRTEVLRLREQPLLADWGISPADRLQILLRALATYGGLLLWPAHLQMDRQLVQGGPELHLLTAGGVAVILALVGMFRRGAPVVRFGVAWFGVTILPVAGLLGLTATVAEHWLYLPAIGLYLAGAVWLAGTRFNPRWVTAVTLPVIAALGLRTAARNRDWRDGVTLYTATANAAPHSHRVRNNLGLAHTAAGHFQQALAELHAAEQLQPADAQLKANLAVVYQLTGQLDAAAHWNMECLRLDPHNVGTLLRIAHLYEARGNIPRARDHFMAALTVTTEVEPRLVFARFLIRQRRLREALRVVADASDLDPGNAAPFLVLGDILTLSRRYPLAAEAFAMAATLDPHGTANTLAFP